MNSFLPDFPWCPCQRVADLPEAHLIYAIILQAWLDASKKIICPIRIEARDWFFSDQFENLCEHVGLPLYVIQDYAKQYWGLN